MSNEITKVERKSQALTMKWDYDTFLSLGRVNFQMLGKAQIEIVRILYRANKELSQQGFRSDKKLYKNDTTLRQMSQSSELHTFKDFCESIGIVKRTAERWLEAYDAENDRLMTSSEVREMKAREQKQAQDELFGSIHARRASGEPEYKPNGWTDIDELMYERWLESKGYKKAPDVRISEYPVINKYGQFGLFTDEYLDSIARSCIDEVAGDKAIKFSNLCDRYKSEIPKGIQPRDVMRIPVMVRVALNKLPAEARKESARIVAEVILAEEVQ